MPNDAEDGIGTNWCQLVESLTSDAGFALLTADGWYNAYNRDANSALYKLNNVPDYLAQGLTPPRSYAQRAKRWLQENPLRFDDLILDEGNSSRYRSAEELWDGPGLKRCDSKDCQEEIADLGLEGWVIEQEESPGPVTFGGIEPVRTPASTTAAVVQAQARQPQSTDSSMLSHAAKTPAPSSAQSASHGHHHVHRHMRAHQHDRLG